MGIQFTLGHVGGGSQEVDVLPERVDSTLVSLLEVLYDANDEHYQAYVTNAAGAGMSILDSGLMVWDTDVSEAVAPTRYYRPATRAEAVELLNAFIYLRHEQYAPLLVPDVPLPGPGLDFLLVGMGEFALHRAAWAGNFKRVKQLVEAGHDVNQRVPEGTTPLVGAVCEGRADMCRFLIEHRADVTVRLPSDEWGTGGWGLLRLARKEGFHDVVRLLEEAEAPE